MSAVLIQPRIDAGLVFFAPDRGLRPGPGHPPLLPLEGVDK